MSTVILLVAIGLAVVFDVTNGFHDSANSVAALVATRAATPGQALVLATVGNFAGPLLMGTAVADTVGGVVTVAPNETLPAVGAALTAAIGWNLVTWWFGLPSSSSHALIGGLIGAAVAAGGFVGVRWGRYRPRQARWSARRAGRSCHLSRAWCACRRLGMAVAGRALRRARREFNSVVRRGGVADCVSARAQPRRQRCAEDHGCDHLVAARDRPPVGLLGADLGAIDGCGIADRRNRVRRLENRAYRW